MASEITTETEKDEELNERFLCYCKTNDGELSKETEELRNKLPILAADIEKSTAEKLQLDQQLTEHQATRASAKEAIDGATKRRGKEATEYGAASGELKSNIASMEQAQEALHRGLTASFVQSKQASNLRNLLLTDSVAHLNRISRDTLTSFLSTTTGYTPASGEVIGILHQMQQDFEASLKDIEATETSAVSEFEGLVQAKEQEIQAATEAIESKTARAGEAAVQIVSLKNELKDVQESLGEDELFLMNLKKNCASKGEEYAARKAGRAEEQVAISETIKILNSDDALDLMKSTLPSPAFLQTAKDEKELRKAAIKLLSKVKGASDRSVDLNFITLALRGKAKGFEKVVKMIDDMIVQLATEKVDDEKHRDWCNVEFNSAGNTAADLSRRADDLGTRAAESEEAVKALVEDLAGLRDGLKDLDRSVEDATTQRKDEHSQFLAEQTQNNAALQLLELARNRMAKFYQPATYVEPAEFFQGESLLQFTGSVAYSTHKKGKQEPDDEEERKPRKAAPRTGGPYEKKSAGGPLALLDKLSHELELDMASATRDESEGQRAYENFMGDSVRKREADSAAVTEKEAQKAELEADVMASKDLKKRKTTELMATREYIQQLHGSCDFMLKNFQMRVEARANEVDALKNAKAVLHGASYSFAQKSKSFLQQK